MGIEFNSEINRSMTPVGGGSTEGVKKEKPSNIQYDKTPAQTDPKVGQAAKDVFTPIGKKRLEGMKANKSLYVNEAGEKHVFVKNVDKYVPVTEINRIVTALKSMPKEQGAAWFDRSGDLSGNDWGIAANLPLKGDLKTKLDRPE